MKSKTIRFGLVAMFLTGFSALLFQVIWIRSFSTLFGGTSLSLSCVIAHFMLGLGLGNRFAPGILKSTMHRKIPLYTICEWLIVAFVGLSFTILFFRSHWLVEFLKTTVMPRLLAHFVLSGILVFPATFLMGFSFPLISYLFPHAKDHQWLYAANCIGGALGGFFSYAVLISSLGLHLTLGLGLCANILAGLLFVKQRFAGSHANEEIAETAIIEQSSSSWFPVALSAFSGLILLSLEQVWFRLAGLFIGGRIYVHTLVLTVILLCLGVAAFLSPKFSKKNESQLLQILFAAFMATLVSVVVGLYMIPDVLPSMLNLDHPSLKELRPEYFAIFAFTAVIPSMLLGICFPLAIELIQRGQRTAFEKTRALAKALYLNTAMSVVGSLMTTYLLFPRLGTIGTFQFFYAALGAFALAAAILAYSRQKTRLVASIVVLGALLVLGLRVPTNLNPAPPPIYESEDEYGYVSINKLADHLDENGQSFSRWGLFHNYVSLVGAFGNKDTQTVQYNLALFPAVLAESVQDVLIVGMGFGITPQAFLKLPEVHKITAVELLPEVMAAQYEMSFHDTTYLKDPRLQLVVDDGRSFIFQAHQKWDIISINIDPYGVGATGLYSLDFYRMAATKLKPGGIYTQMIYGAPRDVAHILATLSAGFKHVRIMPGYPGDGFIVLASNEALPSWEAVLAKGHFSRVSNLLPGRAWDVPTLAQPADFAAAEVVGREASEQIKLDFKGQIITDENLLVETNRSHFWDLFQHYPDDYF